MIAVDTNVIVRLIADDDPMQAAQARALADAEEIWVSTVALVECEWVLRSALRWTVPRIADAFEALLLAPGVHVELADHVVWAVARFRGGADFADMILLVAGRETTGFATFDRRLAQLAGPDTPLPIEYLSG
jgi:predicted nucleic-acid-binding protein